jgi:transitional endoplasmic reticulum ATPase
MTPAQTSTTFSEAALKKSQAETLARLRELGGGKITEESGIAYHDGRQILLPRGMSYKQAAKLTQAQAISMEETHSFTKTFRYRPYDGAFALQETLKEIFGIGGTGKTIHSFFGSQPPQYINVEVGVGEEIRVPWGHIDFPPFEGTFVTGSTHDPVYGLLFQVTCNAPKKYEPEINGLWIAVEEMLRTRSIYKGKAIIGVGKVTREGMEMPSFMDPYAIDPNKVAFAQEVFDSLRVSIWGPIRTAALQRAAGLKLNRKSLLYGPFGTGKSLVGGLTARVAVNNGWTFIQTKTGEEDLDKVLKTAELYAPAVVFIEDIDTLIETDPGEMAKLLELFDGVSSKNKEVMVLMTSNYIQALSKGMTRVGRIDAAIEIGSLDQDAIRRLLTNSFENQTPYDGSVDNGTYEAMSKTLSANDLRLRVESMLADDVDFEAIYEAMTGYEPAFIMGTFNLAKSNAIIRTESLDFKLTTEDFVLAADTLRNQHDTHTNAVDRPAVDTFGRAFQTVVEQATGKTLVAHQVDLSDGEIVTRSS